VSAVIRVIGLIAGRRSPHDGRFVVDYDPTPIACGEPPVLVTTSDIEYARRFDSTVSALRFWQMDSGLLRDDGKPDRPLTAYTVEITKCEA
jgi:hypothetical protein